ncbi:MAG: undecaprenyl-diphosphate phosphatase [Bdellovibrionales bacterium]|nr:undecaprenyl-diphosphate phosphatase [Bdellovibrionales bacterium]
MNEIQAVALGAVQGLGEFLPISSSGHLILTPWLFGWEDQGLAFDVALHVGTLLAVVSYYWRTWLGLGHAAFRFPVAPAEDRRLILLLLAATVPGAVMGKFLNDYAETVFRHPLLVACTLAGVGLLLWHFDRRAAHAQRTLRSLSFPEVLLIGVAQGCALVPGVSRMGATVTAALALGLKREEAARFSFYMSLPITAGAVVLKLPKMLERSEQIGAGIFLLGVGTSAVVGMAAIWLLLKVISRKSFAPFVAYRLVLAAMIAALWLLSPRTF